MVQAGLVLEGGGMKGIYTAGVLDFFMEKDLYFQNVYGVSAGACHLCSYISWQPKRAYHVSLDYLRDKNYCSMRSLLTTGSLFGLQYIYGTMTNEGGGDPLDYDAYHNNPTEAYLPATDAETGLPHYFNKNEIRRNEYQPIMATCALPVACRPISYEGHVYYDGGVSDSMPIEHALEHGCDRLIVIFSKPRGFRMKPQGGKIVYTLGLKHKYPKIVEDLNHRHEVYNRQMDMVDTLEKEGKVMTFCPSADIKIGTYTTDPAVMMQLYDNGIADAQKQMSQIKEFLNGK